MMVSRIECRATAAALLLWSAAASAQLDIDVVGLSQGKAVVIVGNGGKPRVLRDGDVLPNGVRLVQATPQEAVIEIEGKRQTLTLGSHRLSGGHSSTVTNSRVTLIADGAGHFVTIGSINGATVKFLVDTGATMVSMGADEARRIGLNYLKGERGLTRTANGIAPVYRMKLDQVKVGDITVHNVDALVHETDMPWVLLGMSFLNRVEMTRQGDALTLVKRF